MDKSGQGQEEVFFHKQAGHMAAILISVFVIDIGNWPCNKRGVHIWVHLLGVHISGHPGPDNNSSCIVLLQHVLCFSCRDDRVVFMKIAY